jgi:release factor glutamine methyltransferase
MTIREALDEGSAALAAVGIEGTGLDASLLLAEVLNTNRSSLIAAAPQPLTDESIATFNDLIMRRMAGECVAYILGRKEFYGLEFQVNPSVLVPRPDTEILIEVALEQLAMMPGQIAKDGQPLHILDLCTGSGAIAIALKHEMPELEVWATDISAEALEVANANAARLLPPESICFCQGNLFEALPQHTGSDKPSPHSLLQAADLIVHRDQSPSPQSPAFSLIVSNPPYVPSAQIPGLSPEVRAEPILALDGGSDGLDLIRTIVSQAPEYLCPGGTLLLEADPRQMETIATLLQQAGFAGIQTHKGLSGEERVIGGRKE